MKTSLLIFGASITLSCFGQEGNTRIKTLETKHGSFAKFTPQYAESGQGSSEARYTLSTVKTSDGGTATFMNFNSNKVTPSIKKIKEEIFKMSVYPNPATAEINIKIIDEKNVVNGETYLVRIKNLFGQNIHEERFTGKQLQIDASSFAKGFFLVEISTSTGRICNTQKVVIQ